MGSHLRHLVIIGAPKRFWLKSVVDKLQGPHLGQVSLCLFNKLIRLRFPQILKLLRPGWKLADVSTVYQSNWPKNSGQGAPLSLLHEPVPSLKRVTGCKALDAGVSNFSQGAASLPCQRAATCMTALRRPYTSQCTAANLLGTLKVLMQNGNNHLHKPCLVWRERHLVQYPAWLPRVVSKA